jgi:hypothetical protein
MEVPTNLYESIISRLGPTGHVNLLLDVKVISSQVSDHLWVYKSPLPLRQGVRDHFPLHFTNFSSSLLTPLLPLFIFIIKLLDIGLLPPRRSLNQDKLQCAL